MKSLSFDNLTIAKREGEALSKALKRQSYAHFDEAATYVVLPQKAHSNEQGYPSVLVAEFVGDSLRDVLAVSESNLVGFSYGIGESIEDHAVIVGLGSFTRTLASGEILVDTPIFFTFKGWKKTWQLKNSQPVQSPRMTFERTDVKKALASKLPLLPEYLCP